MSVIVTVAATSCATVMIGTFALGVVNVIRQGSADVPVPFTPVLEKAYVPDVERIVGAAREVVVAAAAAA